MVVRAMAATSVAAILLRVTDYPLGLNEEE
jgi:hypothetical protein